MQRGVVVTMWTNSWHISPGHHFLQVSQTHTVQENYITKTKRTTKYVNDTHTHTHTPTYTDTHSHTRSHTRTHTHTHSPSISLSLYQHSRTDTLPPTPWQCWYPRKKDRKTPSIFHTILTPWAKAIKFKTRFLTNSGLWDPLNFGTL